MAPGRGQEPTTPAGVVFILPLFRFLSGTELCGSLGGSGDVLYWEALLVSLPMAHSDSAREAPSWEGTVGLSLCI